MKITRYKIHKWYKPSTKKIIWGIDVIIDSKSYHVKDDNALFFKDKSSATKHVRKLNKELRESNKQPSKK